MYPRSTALAALAVMLGSSAAFAQCGCGVAPVYTTVAPSYVSYYAGPIAPAPYVSSYAPIVAPAPATYVSYYAPPVVAAPAPYVTYYAPAVPAVTYYAPRAAYVPVVAPRVYYAVPGWSLYGTPRFYVPGEPVRNVVKAITP